MSYKFTRTGAAIEALHNKLDNGTIDITYASKSSATDTGSTTTSHARQVNVSGTSTASGLYSQVNSSIASVASGQQSQVNASGTSNATVQYTQVNASFQCDATAQRAQVNASTDCNATSTNAQINASDECEASGNRSQVNSSQLCESTAVGSIVEGSVRIINNVNFSQAGGYLASGNALTENRTYHIFSNLQSGVSVQTSGTISTSYTFSDFAEMMKNGVGTELEPGIILTQIGDSVFPAVEGDKAIGVVSATPGSLHGDTPFCWKGRFKHDEWGRPVTQKITVTEELKGQLKGIPKTFEVDAPVENPEWNPELKQVSRSDRPDEWTKAGLLGLIRVRVDATVTQEDIISMTNEGQNIFIEPSEAPGIGTASLIDTNIQVMEVKSEFEASRGYGIVLCRVG